MVIYCIYSTTLSLFVLLLRSLYTTTNQQLIIRSFVIVHCADPPLYAIFHLFDLLEEWIRYGSALYSALWWPASLQSPLNNGHHPYWSITTNCSIVYTIIHDTIVLSVVLHNKHTSLGEIISMLDLCIWKPSKLHYSNSAATFGLNII